MVEISQKYQDPEGHLVSFRGRNADNFEGSFRIGIQRLLLAEAEAKPKVRAPESNSVWCDVAAERNVKTCNG